jgi:hypothetical protein
MFLLPNLWLVWVDPHQRESKRGTGHVVFVLPNMWLVWVDPHQRESKRGTGHVVFVFPNLTGQWSGIPPKRIEERHRKCHICASQSKRSLVWMDPHQRESKRGTGQVVFVLLNLKCGWSGNPTKENRREALDKSSFNGTWSGWIPTKENRREPQDMSCLCFPTRGWSGWIPTKEN